MKLSSVAKYVSEEVKKITIEPVIFLFLFGFLILYGNQTPTNILIMKICRYEMGHSQEICDNLGDDANKEIQKQGNALKVLKVNYTYIICTKLSISNR